MKIGVPKEIKKSENRVGLTPAGVLELKANGHTVLVQSGAGLGSGFSDESYAKVGADLLATAAEVYSGAEMIVKVKEPIEEEWPLIQNGQLLFTYFHFAASLPLTEAMLQKNAVCIAYETVETPDRTFPLLTPMSEVAGRMAIIEGAKYLEKPFGGKGKLLGGVPGVQPAKVLVLGAGVVGANAAKMAAGFGAQVTITDISLNRLRYISDIMPANVTTLFSNELNIRQLLPEIDLVVGAVMVPGGRTPLLLRKEHLSLMEPGTVLVDVAVDQGGCIETIHPTTHDAPTYFVDGVLHYGVANMPGAMPQTSTHALTNATLPYVVKLANKGWVRACKEHADLALGLNVVNGKITYKNLADSLGMAFSPIA